MMSRVKDHRVAVGLQATQSERHAGAELVEDETMRSFV
jgi:hypothetical protein